MSLIQLQQQNMGCIVLLFINKIKEYMYVEKKRTDEEMNQLKNKFLERNMIHTIINKDATVYTKEGKLLFLFRKKRLTG